MRRPREAGERGVADDERLVAARRQHHGAGDRIRKVIMGARVHKTDVVCAGHWRQFVATGGHRSVDDFAADEGFNIIANLLVNEDLTSGNIHWAYIDYH
jgi:hypothetical protein